MTKAQWINECHGLLLDKYQGDETKDFEKWSVEMAGVYFGDFSPKEAVFEELLTADGSDT